MTEQLKEIAIRLKTLRQIMDVSEEELAEVCGVNLEEYRAYERGKRTSPSRSSTTRQTAWAWTWWT